MSDNDALEKCETCRFYFETQPGTTLQRQTVCRRYPPTGQLLPSNQGVSQLAFFPAVQSGHWCGEFSLSRIVLQ